MVSPIGVTAVYFDGSMAPPNDLVTHTVPWDKILELRNEFPLLTLFIRAENPLGNPAATQFTGHDEFAIGFIPSSTLNARHGLIVSQFDDNTMSGQKVGRKFTFRESRNATESVALTTFTAPILSERMVLSGLDVTFVSLPFTDPAYDDAQLRSLSVTLPPIPD